MSTTEKKYQLDRLAFILRGLCLPSGTTMTEADLDRVVRVVRETREKRRR